MKDKINKGIQEFHALTFFPANWLKCNLHTRNLISNLISIDNKLDGTEISIRIDYDIPDGIVRIGMGVGPSYSEVKL